jgi:hypothetical protein
MGDVIGNVEGNVEGNVIGNVTGNVTGFITIAKSTVAASEVAAPAAGFFKLYMTSTLGIVAVTSTGAITLS